MFKPKWRYHKVKGAKLIKSQAELDALSPEWLDSPASFKAQQSDSNPAHVKKDAKPVAEESASAQEQASVPQPDSQKPASKGKKSIL